MRGKKRTQNELTANQARLSLLTFFSRKRCLWKLFTGVANVLAEENRVWLQIPSFFQEIRFCERKCTSSKHVQLAPVIIIIKINVFRLLNFLM